MESMSTILLSLYRGGPFREDWILAYLDGAWSGLFGEKVANACRPRTLQDAGLIVEVSEKSWLPALSSMKPELLQRIRTITAGEVRELKLVLRRTG